MKRITICMIILVSSIICKAQTDTSYLITGGSYGFIYCKGISYTSKPRNSLYIYEKAQKIIIEGDTMTAVRNLLTYLLEEKNENDYAQVLLSRINLPYMSKLFKDKTFDFYLKGYKIIIDNNKKQRNKQTLK